MQGAGAARDQQRAAAILADDASIREPLLAHGIGREAGGAVELGRVRPDLLEQRIVRIALAHAGYESARNEQRERGARGDAERARWQLEQPNELRGVAYGGAQRGLPRRQRQSLGARVCRSERDGRAASFVLMCSALRASSRYSSWAELESMIPRSVFQQT